MLYRWLLLLLCLFSLSSLTAQEMTQESEKTLVVSESQWIELKNTIQLQSVLLMDSSGQLITLLNSSKKSAQIIKELENLQSNSDLKIQTISEELETSKTELSKANLLLTESNNSLEPLRETITTIEDDVIQLEHELEIEKTKTVLLTIGGVILGALLGFVVGSAIP